MSLDDGMGDVMAQQIDKMLDEQFSDLRRHLAALGEDQNSMAGQLAFLLREAGVSIPDPESEEDSDKPVVQVDQTWQCEKCGAKLGFFDPNANTMRLMWKGWMVWVETGIGGSVSTVCRRCGHLNSVHDAG